MLNNIFTLYSKCIVCGEKKIHMSMKNIEDVIWKHDMYHYLNIYHIFGKDFNKHIKSFWSEWVIFYKLLKFSKWYKRDRISKIWILLYDMIKNWSIISREDADKIVQNSIKRKSGD